MKKEIHDIVITWVDGADPDWLEEKKKYMKAEGLKGGSDSRAERYRDWDSLRFWFRGVEKFAPWVRRIFFVTWGHTPSWLNTSHPRLTIVKHRDFIPEEYLPTYNSVAIELNFHRIKGLSENFIYFNDDVFLIAPVRPDRFFRNGKPCDMLALQPVVANPKNPVMSHIYQNNALVLAAHFDKYENMRKQPWAYFRPGYPPRNLVYNLLETTFPKFTGFYTAHSAASLCVRTYKTLWEQEYDLLDRTCKNRFRSVDDVNQYLMQDWQKLSGDFVPRNVNRRFSYFEVSDDNRKLLETIRDQKADIICVNDANIKINVEKAKAEINQAFCRLLPKKSSFEI